MKIILYTVFTFVALDLLAAGPVELPVTPVTQSAKLNSIDLDLDTDVEFVYRVIAGRAAGDSLDVSYFIEPIGKSRLLKYTSSVVLFEAGQDIGLTSVEFKQLNSDPNMYFNNFRQEEVFPTWFFNDLTFDIPNLFFRIKTHMLIGFRADLEDGRHYGWLKFSRPDTLFPRPFTLDAWDWNPVPDLPIPAGLPPAIPLAGDVVKNESDQPVLRLSWPQAVSAWTLESATNLAPPIQWEYYPTGGAGVDVPLTAEGEPQRYFRLRKP